MADTVNTLICMNVRFRADKRRHGAYIEKSPSDGSDGVAHLKAPTFSDHIETEQKMKLDLERIHPVEWLGLNFGQLHFDKL